MINEAKPLEPDWVSLPGDTIAEIMEEAGWSQRDLAGRLGYSEKHLSLLINGDATITRDTAQRLERVLGGGVEFWLNLEANYQRDKARIEAQARCHDWVGWLEQFPVKFLMDHGMLKECRLTQNNKPGVVDELLRFFRVATPDEWQSQYADLQLSFRRSQRVEYPIGLVSAWLRMGEHGAEKLGDLPKYNARRFEKALAEVRGLTRSPADEFSGEMRRLLAEAGVRLVFVPFVPRSHVSGVARWLAPTKPLIQLSLLGKTNDKFWFTFFHEAAHILLHGKGSGAKESIYLDDPNSGRSEGDQEHEANQWAADYLIPQEYAVELNTLKARRDIVAFAEKLSLHPGIVVGRLQHEGIIPFSQFNDLKQRLDFKAALPC